MKKTKTQQLFEKIEKIRDFYLIEDVGFMTTVPTLTKYKYKEYKGNKGYVVGKSIYLPTTTSIKILGCFCGKYAQDALHDVFIDIEEAEKAYVRRLRSTIKIYQRTEKDVKQAQIKANQLLHEVGVSLNKNNKTLPKIITRKKNDERIF